MKTVEDETAHLIAARMAEAIAPGVSFIETSAKRAMQRLRAQEWKGAVNTIEGVIHYAEEAPARKAAAAIAGALAITIGIVVLVVKLAG